MTMLRALLSAVLLFGGWHLHAQDVPPDVRKAACAHMVEAVQSVVEARDAGVSKSKMLEEVTGQSGKSQPSGADKDKLRFLVAFAYNSRTAGDADDRSLTWSISSASTGSAEVSKSTGTRQYERSESYVPHPIGASARDPGVSPETITISLTRGTFVYSSQHVNPMMNRANIYIGHCRALGDRAP